MVWSFFKKKSAEELLEEGCILHLNDKVAEALQCFSQAIEKEPDLIEAYQARAKVFTALGKDEEALADIEKVLASKPKDVDCLHARADILEKRGLHDKALKDIDLALEVDSDNHQARASRASILYHLRYFEESYNECEAIMRHESNMPKVIRIRGLNQIIYQQYQDAVESFSQLLRIEPDKKNRTYRLRAIANAWKGDYEESITDLNSIISSEPENFGHYSIRGFVYSKMGEDEKAEADYQMFAEKHAPILKKFSPQAARVFGVVFDGYEQLFEPGPENLPCRVLFTFDPVTDAQIVEFRNLIERINALMESGASDQDEEFMVETVSNSWISPPRRCALPTGFAGWPIIYLTDVMIHRPYLPEKYIVDDVLPFIAEPGETGNIELLPYWEAEE